MFEREAREYHLKKGVFERVFERVFECVFENLIRIFIELYNTTGTS